MSLRQKFVSNTEKTEKTEKTAKKTKTNYVGPVIHDVLFLIGVVYLISHVIKLSFQSEKISYFHYFPIFMVSFTIMFMLFRIRVLGTRAYSKKIIRATNSLFSIILISSMTFSLIVFHHDINPEYCTMIDIQHHIVNPNQKLIINRFDKESSLNINSVGLLSVSKEQEENGVIVVEKIRNSNFSFNLTSVSKIYIRCIDDIECPVYLTYSKDVICAILFYPVAHGVRLIILAFLPVISLFSLLLLYFVGC